MADVRACQNCHGKGTVTVEVTPGKFVTKKCPAGCKNGKAIISTI